MEKQEIFDLLLKYPNAQEFYKVLYGMGWEWHKNGEVVSTNDKKNS
jgi:hypothetical protein